MNLWNLIRRESREARDVETTTGFDLLPEKDKNESILRCRSNGPISFLKVPSREGI